MQLDLN